MTHLVGGEVTRDEEADKGQRDDRNALGERRRRVAPAERPVVVGSERTAADARSRNDHHSESDHQHADQGVDAVGRCTRGPEDERRQHHPDADSGRDPLQPLPAPVHAEEREYDDEDARQHLADPETRVADCRLRDLMPQCRRKRHSHWIEQSKRKRRRDKPEPERGVGHRRPEGQRPVPLDSRLNLLLAAFQRSLEPFGGLHQLRLRRRHYRGLQLVLFVPIGRVFLQPPDHFRQRGDQAVPRLPTQQLPRARDVDLVVIVGVLDHPRLDVGVLVEHLRLDPCSCLGEALRKGERAPVLAVDEAPYAFLHFFVGRRFFLADQKDRLVGKLRAPIHGAHDGVDKIFLVQVRLSAADVPGEQIGCRQPLEDAGDLLGNECRAAILVVDPGKPEDHRT